MNKFMFFACLAVLGSATARPDLSRQAYRYDIGQNENVVNAGIVSTPVITSSSSYQPTASGSSYYNTVPSVGQLTLVGNSGLVPSTQISSVNGVQYTGRTTYSNGGGVGGAGVTYASNGGVIGGAVGGDSGSYSSSNGAYTSGGSSVQGIVNDNIGLTGIHPGPTVNYKEQEAYISHLANFQPPVISKHFYLHTAPEDHDDQQIVRYVNVGRPQKNYRVVFINAPASTTSKAKIIANVAPVEDKTAIYVLSKKSNALDVSAEVVTQRPVNHKPEVFFIKYKTPAEAAHAQQTIQANYDALGGSSQLTDEGLVPVSSVINSLGDNGASGVLADGSGGVNIVGTGGAPIVETISTGAGSNNAGSIQYDINGSGSSNSQTAIEAGSSIVGGNNLIQTTYLPAKPIRSVKY